MKRISRKIVDCFRKGGKLLICGNGGSAAMSQEMAAELVCTFENKNRPPLPAIALTTDTSILTAWSNDCEFADVFARQVAALGKKDDILILFTTSGKSMSCNHAIPVCMEKGIKWFIPPLRGKGAADIQERQHHWMHQVCREVEKEMFG